MSGDSGSFLSTCWPFSITFALNKVEESFNPLSDNAPYFIILLCLMPDDFSHQGESAATQ